MLNRNLGANTLRILYYCSGWPTNIGNAFIDLGAIALLRAAAPHARIAFASEMPRWIFEHADKRADELGSRKWSVWRSARQPYINNALDLVSVVDCDLLVFAGMAMCDEFIKVNGPPVLTLASRGVPVLLLGTGAQKYCQEEKNQFGAFLRDVRPIGFISRDDRSFEMFAEFVPNSEKGIDCGFFVADAYPALPLVLPPYIVAAFDSMQPPALESNGRQIIHAHHNCWDPIPVSHLRIGNTLISDLPYDYLSLYAAAEEVHSDRVHACVAALAYGRRARFYGSTPRASLFDAVGATRIMDSFISLEPDLLSEKKMGQVESVRRLITEYTSIRSQAELPSNSTALSSS